MVARGGGCERLRIEVELDAGLPLERVTSRWHEIVVQQAERSASVELARGATELDRDFELSWELGGRELEAGLVVQHDEDGGFFTLVLDPPEALFPDQASPRDLVFVVDTSGSMGGVPITTAKAAMKMMIGNLHPDDRFQIVRFAESASALGEAFVTNTDEGRALGLDFVERMHGRGGTSMLAGLETALGLAAGSRRTPIVLLLTDGYIGNEAEVFATIERRLGDARLFSLGVGSAVNHHLLDGVARVGRGAVTTVGPSEDPEDVVDRFYDRIAFPAMVDVTIDWGDLEVHDVVPERIPDVFVGQPVVVYGRYRGTPRGRAIVHGRRGDESIEIPIEVDVARARAGEGIASMWARKRVADLLEHPRNLSADADVVAARRERAIELALRHNIMTAHTAFVAVDHSHVTNPDRIEHTVAVPVELPRGMIGKGRGGGGTGEGTIGLGTIGLIGRGGGGGTGSGYGTGSGAGFGGRGSRVPQVRQAKAEVTGAIDRDIIRRIVRAHINEVRYCYNRGLVKDPKLAGRVVIAFVIEADGRVASAEVTSDTTGTVGECVAKAVARWRFPKPTDGAKVKVSYPFVLEPG